ncbi:FAD-binding and (Fe-S)-binding domain-containing protein [Nocardioides sp. CER19]|uniref:FAD-binding and (Fe-S)-binding domain-containing protein n=1 Tax=Nocardioides sp. CER19 TaxID=3038538 RepID=UPI00244B62A1|nr:FAD-binding and (Fe-S)-binding domain-containing protein [Nocardioides sp. CER19]MDH2414537.1 FAD-binding and (Fe-S)-binding domain-containing protein [Nocardioides sp. CER19]
MPGVTAVALDLAAELRSRGVSGVDDSTLATALYSSDASLYRLVPQVVVKPRHTDELVAIHEASRALGVPVTLRGAGTSIAGNAVGTGIVVDTRLLNRVLAIDPDARTARVEPGLVHADLQRAAAPYGLRFGPDPSTHPRCTIGGMIGNNACGSRALGYGRTVDNVEAMTVVWGSGEVATYDGSAPAGAAATGLLEIADANLAHLRTEFGRFGRQVSGYSLEHLLPEKGRRIDRFLVGTEGTLATVLEATVRLVQDEPGRLLLVLGYPTMHEAADAVPGLLAAAAGRLIACEGMDARIVELVRAKGGAVPELPKGGGWLMAEVAGPDAPDLVERLRAAGGALDARLVTDTAEAATLWRIREDGAGLAGRSLPTPAYSGWEDAAVPPEHLGAWLRDFDEILAGHGLQGVPYGHFGDGCIHCRIDFPFAPGDPASAGVFRDFMTACAHKLKDYGGSLSGEHGDGRVRSELLPLMYDDHSIALFGSVKRLVDPNALMNPGNIVDPASITEDLRPVRPRASVRPALRLVHDDGDLGAAVHRCTGVGKCVAPHTNGVMCPSYLATGNEKDATRGRARVLQEALDGGLVHGLSDPAVHEALDLCLACKGCASDCPTGIDMATYKSEVLHQSYAGRRRPRSHYLLGRLPFWARLGAPFARLTNLLMRLAPLAWIAKWFAGIDQRRSVPRFAPVTLKRSAATASLGEATPDVWVWADSFTDHFFTRSGQAAIRYLEAQGLTVRVISDRACCGLTWITTGQLDQARSIMERTVRTLAPYVASGVPVIGLEPSCLATLRSDSVELSALPEARTVADGMLTFAELVTRLDLPLPDLAGVEVVAQPHCHQHAVLGWAADQRLLEKAGATVTKVAGCCGLAGNFGVEEGHYEVSVAVAETHLLPAVRSHPDAVVLADGMSCRVQLDDLAQVPTMHLAELFASRL